METLVEETKVPLKCDSIKQEIVEEEVKNFLQNQLDADIVYSPKTEDSKEVDSVFKEEPDVLCDVVKTEIENPEYDNKDETKACDFQTFCREELDAVAKTDIESPEYGIKDQTEACDLQTLCSGDPDKSRAVIKTGFESPEHNKDEIEAWDCQIICKEEPDVPCPVVKAEIESSESDSRDEIKTCNCQCKCNAKRSRLGNKNGNKKNKKSKRNDRKRKNKRHDQNGDSEDDEETPHIKKPLNAFMLFMKDARAEVVAESRLKESHRICPLLGHKGGRQMTNEERLRAVEMLEDGVAARQVAATLNVSHTAINKLRKKWMQGHSTERRPGSGRQKGSTEDEDRALVEHIQQHPFDSAEEAKAATGFPASVRTARQRIADSGLRIKPADSIGMDSDSE